MAQPTGDVAYSGTSYAISDRSDRRAFTGRLQHGAGGDNLSDRLVLHALKRVAAAAEHKVQWPGGGRLEPINNS